MWHTMQKKADAGAKGNIKNKRTIQWCEYLQQCKNSGIREEPDNYDGIIY